MSPANDAARATQEARLAATPSYLQILRDNAHRSPRPPGTAAHRPHTVSSYDTSTDEDAGSAHADHDGQEPRIEPRIPQHVSAHAFSATSRRLLRRQFPSQESSRHGSGGARRPHFQSPSGETPASSSTDLKYRFGVPRPAPVPCSPETPQVRLASPHPMHNTLLALLLAALSALCCSSCSRGSIVRSAGRPTSSDQRFSLIAGIPAAAFAAHRVDADIERAFERLRDSLIYLDPDRRPRVVAIVSPLGNEGRTTVAAGLAASFARTGKRVVLVDADLQTPESLPAPGVPEAPGLTDVLAGYELDGALRFAERFDGDLTVLPAGSTSAFASDLVGSAEMSRLLDQLSGRFDFVVVDTAPLLSSSGPLAIVARVQGVVAVARLNQTRRDAVARMMRLAGTVDGRVVGVVATNARAGHDDDVSDAGVARWRATTPPRAPSPTG